jgi:hypothetical protein
MTIRRTLLPLLNKYAMLFTQVLKDYFHDDRFVVSWVGFEEPTDLESQANAYKTMISAYMISPSDAARAMHQPVSIEIPILFPTATGPMFFDDLLDPGRRKAQQDAQMAGLQMAAQNPGAKQDPTQDDESENEDDTTPMDEKTSSTPANKSKPAGKGNSSPQSKSGTVGSGDNKSEKPDTRAIIADLKRWRTVALHDLKSRRNIRAFESDLLPVATRASIASQLEACATAEEVRAVFSAVSLDEEQPDFLAEALLGGASQSRNPNGARLTQNNLLWRDVSPIASRRS